MLEVTVVEKIIVVVVLAAEVIVVGKVGGVGVVQ